jgi:DNA-binding NarL/FixJ family response regulator
MSIRILIVEDHPITRLGLRVVLEGHDGFIVVGESRDGLDALRQVEELEPDVVLMDLGMPGLDGFACTSRLKAGATPVRVVIHSSHEEEAAVKAALSSGADGYCFKDSSDYLLIDAIKTVVSGVIWLDPRIPEHLHQYHQFQK